MHSLIFRKFRLSLAPLFLCGIVPAAFSQAQADAGFQRYLIAVEQNNLDLQAQRETVASAQAGVSIAGVRPDPQFTAGIDSKELYGPNKQNTATTTIAGLAITIETADKRRARIRAAESNVRLSDATVGAFRRQLFADSATAYIEACRSSAALKRHETSLQAMREIARANEVRFRTGDIGKLELVQSRVEADRFGTDVVSARADTSAAEMALSVFLGKPYKDVLGEKIDCEFRQDRLAEDERELIRRALENREDVQLAKSSIANARDNIDLAKANRWIDPVVNIGVKNTPKIYPIVDAGGNVVNTPAEHSNSLGLTVTIPIPLSRLQSGELRQAQSALTQAQLQMRSVLLKAETDVRTSFTQYQAASQNVQSYREHVLEDAERLLEGVRLSYRKGASSLLDLLNAQRTADDIYLAYLQAQANLANARIKLQQSAGKRPEI
ncbi:TolC family protein [Undibacterium sp.]|jgi:cobalt-zinc-cadmium efflux system outer membrane protein|uniref:TolC family protein n=1 Tax=Undibacterium sp. TaxID=1914977 RepID=UPI002D01306C|nr:TolC family protein [Undibacterium sp.]HTD04896.1 TolC family protein [Undibacterium sp.]